MPLSAYFSVVSSILACELSRIYFSSPVGKDGESGSAMASLAKIASSVTICLLIFYIYILGIQDNSTYVVIAVLREEGDPLASQLALRFRGLLLQVVLSADDVGN